MPYGWSCSDHGPGIADINLAMQEGFSTATAEMRVLGFGAGMGLPNIRRNTDLFEVESTPGAGTTLRYAVCFADTSGRRPMTIDGHLDTFNREAGCQVRRLRGMRQGLPDQGDQGP